MIEWPVATLHGIVLLYCRDFKGPDWGCRVSFANLEDRVLEDIGRAIRSMIRGYYQACRVSEGSPPLAATARASVT
jgi:aspartate 4-decarboxylase